MGWPIGRGLEQWVYGMPGLNQGVKCRQGGYLTAPGSHWGGPSTVLFSTSPLGQPVRVALCMG